MSFTRFATRLILVSLLFFETLSYSIEGLYPDCGPTDGYTRVTVYSSAWYGYNYSSHPQPLCKFGDSTPEVASWIHCTGTNNSDTRDETCLNCQSPPGAKGNSTVQVSVNGDWTDTVETSFQYYEPPLVDWAEPFIGKKPGGTLVHVHGQNFENLPALGCVFGSIIVPAKFISSKMISCRSPKSEVVDAVIPLKVTQNVQQSSQSWIKYYYYSVPEISQLIPDSGPTTGGTEVYIKGRQMYPFQSSDIYIDNTTFVSFGRGHYTRATLINTTHAKAISPPSLVEGSVPVEITFNDQEWTRDGIPFTYYAPPYVLELIPNFGAVQGGTNVTVIGANFYNSSDTKCRFGTKVVPGYYIDATSVWCVTPPGEKTGYVDFGLALTQDRYSGNELKYLYIDPPVISSLTPMCGPTSGYTQIAIIGKNFVYIGLNKAICLFGDKFQQTATVVNESLIYCDSPSVLDKFGNNPNNITRLPLKLTLNRVDYLNTNKEFVYYTQPTLSLISPFNGPVAGGTIVVATVKNVTDYCDLTCRFGTMEVTGQLSQDNQVTCVTPAVTCPGNTVVQVSLNRQQYTTNQYDNYQTVFYYYKNLVVAYVTPDIVPTAGGSEVTVYGEGFLMSRNTTTAPDGKVIISYLCRYQTQAGDIIETLDAKYVDNNIIVCLTPKVDDPIDNVVLQVSPNGQNWEPVIYKNINFYRAPEAISCDPKFGKIKQKGTTLNVYGKYFDCPDNDCSEVKCAFTTADMRVVTAGSRQSSDLIVCDIPPISRPEVTNVQVSLNGLDYTTQNVTYTFYDAFILSVDPPYVPVEGNTTATLNGYGFANTGQLKVELLDSANGSTLVCGGSPCIIDATYISQSEVQFTVPPQSDVRDASGNPIEFRPFVVEVSIYEDSFTRNGVEIQYFEQPIVGALTSDGSPFTYHTNAVETVRIPVTIRIPEGSTKATFLNFAKIRCRFQVQDETVDTIGIVVDYPFPIDINSPTNELSRIECPTPKTTKLEDGVVSVSLNGRDFVGNNPIYVKPELKLLSVTPQCGPKEGGTAVSMSVQGFVDDDFNKLFFTWSTVCTDVLSREMLVSPNTLATVAPPVAYLSSSPGGTSLATFAVNKIIQYNNGTQSANPRNYLDSSAEFLFYRTPSVVHTFPHSGNAAGGTPVIVDGAYFFTDPRHSCTPKCKFGDKIVEAEWISTVRLKCLAPAGTEGVVVPLTITMNGVDETPVVRDQTYTFTSNPIIQSIHPDSGPTSGGTAILVTGTNFVDLSAYPEEFLCRFSSSDARLPPKSTPASYLNETSIMCTSPGGWSAGNIARLQITYNGVDLSNDNNTFRFYQVDTIHPLSGPSVGGTEVTILGSGFQAEGGQSVTKCKIAGVETQAISVNWTHIVCNVPPAPQGPTFYGHEQFYYTLDGANWHQIIQGYTYYEQPLVSELIPPFIPKEGGTVTVRGEKFITDWYSTALTCRLGNTVVLAEFINNTHVNCAFRRIDIADTPSQYLQIALNDVSYTANTAAARIYVFYVTKMTPESGVLDGGTQIQLEGVNYPPNYVPLCRFGITSRSTITFGNRVSPQQLVCTAPPGDPPGMADYPLEILFSLSFDKDTYKTWAWEGMHYYYYRQPEIQDIEPKSAILDQNTLVRITSTNLHPFNDSLIGSLVTNDVRIMSTNIVCKFGKFGTSKGALISNTEVTCPTPNTKLNLEEIGEEPVKVEIAMNGQDFATPSSVYFKFVGTKSPTNYGIIWILAIIIGAVVLLFLLYFISKACAGTGATGVQPDAQSLVPKSPFRGDLRQAV